MRFFSIYFFLISIFLFSCKKDNSSDVFNYDYLSANFKPYMFKDGSYWVYIQDSTGVLDSITITSTKQGFFLEPPLSPMTNSKTKIEYYKINLHDHLTSSDYNDFLFSSIITRNGNESPAFGQPILLSLPIGSKTDGAEVFDTIPILSIGGNTFFNVLEMKIFSSEQIQHTFNNDTYLYFKDSIGLVRKEIDLGGGNIEKWSLIRWHIIL